GPCGALEQLQDVIAQDNSVAQILKVEGKLSDLVVAKMIGGSACCDDQVIIWLCLHVAVRAHLYCLCCVVDSDNFPQHKIDVGSVGEDVPDWVSDFARVEAGGCYLIE